MNRSRLRLRVPVSFALCALLFAVVSQLSAQTISDPAYAAEIAAARDTIRAAMKANETPGASVTVSIDGTVRWSEGFGVASVELRAPATPHTKFRIGSVSKSLTAGGLTLLIQDRKLDLDKQVQQYVPSFPVKRYPITVRQAAGHLAGIRHYRGDEFLSQRRYPTIGEGLEIFKDDSLLFEPGSKYSYSSYGFNLVSAAMEGASGEPFLAFMHDRVFAPLGMNETVPEYPDSIIMDRSAFYSAGPVHTNAPMVDNSYKWAGGGFLSTTEDLVKYANAVMSGDLFTQAGRDVMFTTQQLNDGTETGYSIGWGVRRSNGLLYVSHSGGSVGGTAMLILVPEKRIAIALLCNDDSRFTRAAGQALKVFLRE